MTGVWRPLSTVCLLAILLMGTANSAKAQGGVSLRELVVLPSAQTAPPPAQPGQVDVSAIDVPEKDSLAAHLQQLVGHIIDRSLIDSATQTVTQHFNEMGHPFVDVGFPQQDITDGILRMVAAEYHIDAVTVVGNAWFSDDLIRNAAGLAVGGLIDKAELDRRLQEFGASPFIKITPEFSPGPKPDTTDVTLRVADQAPVQVSLGYSDSGSATTGWNRWSLGVTATDPTLSGTQISYGFVSSDGVLQHLHPAGEAADAIYELHQASLIIPLPSGDRLTLSGSMARQIPQLGKDLGSVGLNTNFGLDYTHPLVRGPAAAWGATGESVGIAYDFKRSNNNLAFGGTSVQRNYTVLSQFSLHYGAAFGNALGLLQAQDTLVLSPGGMTPENTNRALRPAGTAQSGVPGASAQYVYDRVVITQLVPLPKDYGLVLRATGQASSTTLLASEQISIAGIDAVRGYSEFGVSGSQGVVFSTELRGPNFSPSGLITGQDGPDSAQLHIFGDVGRAWNPTGSSNAPAAGSTASLGFGGQMTVADNLAVRLEQGWELLRSNRQSAHGAFLHAAVTATW